MITALLNDTRAKIELAKRLKDAQSEVKAITAGSGLPWFGR